MRALLITVGADLYAFEMSSVREVAAAPIVTPLPSAPAPVLGVFNLRGEIVPAYDTAALLGFGAISEWRFIVVIETASGSVGFVSSGAPESAELGEPVADAEAPGCTATYAIDGRVAVQLDVQALLASTLAGAER